MDDELKDVINDLKFLKGDIYDFELNESLKMAIDCLLNNMKDNYELTINEAIDELTFLKNKEIRYEWNYATAIEKSIKMLEKERDS
jgi:hypothetical protein